MKVFISWSGDQSYALAKALHEWLPLVLHYVEPWLSHSDIEAGERWSAKIAKELEVTNFGIICVTKENINAPWLLFEAGALAKSMENGKVIPLLLDIEFKEISGPLAQFQAKKIEKAGIIDVISSINNAAPQQVTDARLNQLLESLWNNLETKITKIPKKPTSAKPSRPESEILEELVSGIRGLEVRLPQMIEETTVRMMHEIKASKSKDETIIKDILLSSHPAFEAIKKVASVPYRIAFHNISELNALLSQRGFVQDETPNDPKDLEWDNKKAKYGIRVTKSIFDQEGKLKIYTPQGWDNKWVKKYDYDPEEPEDDDESII